MSFVVKTEGVIWMDRSFSGDQRRNFIATYVIDDGYDTPLKCKEAVASLGYDPEEFAYLYLNHMWYAVNVNSYYTHMIITKDRVIYTKKAFQDCADMLSIEEARKTCPPIHRFKTDNKRWQNGVQQDLLMFDPSLRVFFGSREYQERNILHNNVVITFGLSFFITEVCIKTTSYASHVFSYYFNNTSLTYLERTVNDLNRKGYFYFNPFTKSVSRDYKEKNRKEKAVTKGLDIPKPIMREWKEDRTKSLKPREVNPGTLHIRRGY